jgi:hypothetical protein
MRLAAFRLWHAPFKGAAPGLAQAISSTADATRAGGVRN